MKAVRLALLLLLAVLLPLRGAVAATLLCAAGGAGVTSEVHPDHHDATGHGQPADAAAPDEGAPAGHHGEGSHGHTASDKCTVCAACCSIPPLAGTTPSLSAPLGPAAVKFADHAAPAPSFLRGGPERPPRTR